MAGEWQLGVLRAREGGMRCMLDAMVGVVGALSVSVET